MIQLKNVSKEFKDGHKVEKYKSDYKQRRIRFSCRLQRSWQVNYLKLLLKEVEPTSGTIIVGDKDITKYKRKEIPYTGGI